MKNFPKIFSVFFASVYFWYYASTYTEWHFLDSVNLIFHEAGHAVFFFLGEFIQVCAGSGFQIALPLFIVIYFFVHEQKLSAGICMLWVGQNFLNVSVYAGDAVNMELPLLGGDSSIHDWNYILKNTGLLRETATVANIFYFLGLLFITFGTVYSLYLVTKDFSD